MDHALIEQKLESLRRCLARLRARCPTPAPALAVDIDAQDIVALNLARAVHLLRFTVLQEAMGKLPIACRLAY